MMEFTYTQYVDAILSGAQAACEWIRLACERHVADLERDDIYFDHRAARRAIGFFKLLRHSKGEWAGRPFLLEPWQQFIVGSLFGWKQVGNGLRRFRTCYLEVARKNGKSTLAAGIGLYLLLADNEPGAEIYAVATKRDQARISHAEATRMCKAAPALRKEVKIVRDNISIPGTASKFEALSSDYNSLDGLDAQGLLIDELHAHKTRDLWDVLNTSTGSRRQPLIFAITTAGTDRGSICYKQHSYTQSVLRGAISDDTHFGLIYSLDTNEVQGSDLKDSWDDEATWVKANPNLGVCKKLADLQRKARKAKEMPAALNAFLRKELNIWTQATTRWIPHKHWDECGKAVDAEGLRGRIAYGGLDLGSVSDLTAWVLVFPPQVEGDAYQVLCRFFVPDEAMHKRTRRDRVPYEAWVRQGYITATPGNVTDYEYVLAQIDRDMQAYDVREIAFDAWGASAIQTKLMELGGEKDFLVQFRQGYRSMSPPMKELGKLILGHQLAHGNDPVLRWQADNLVARTDPAGNIKPDRKKSIEKIDGMVALIMALDRALRREPPRQSVYEKRGLEVV